MTRRRHDMQTAAAKRDEAVGGVAVAIVPEPGTRENPFVPLAAVAHRLGVSRRTVRRMVYERGLFPGARRVEGRLCIPEEELRAYVRDLPRAVHA
jgi:excisionase family DNA binding protein